MPRFRSMALRPIHRIKHVIDSSTVLAKNTNLPNGLVDATDTPSLGSTTSVETASKVNGIYLKVIVASNEDQVAGAIPNVYMALYKNPGNNLSFPNPNVIGSSELKRFVFHQEMVMIDNKKGGQPTVLFNGVVVIPKGHRRMAPDDRIAVDVFCPQIDIVLCIQAHYKEFR